MQLCVISGFLCGVNEVFTLLESVTSQSSEDLIEVISHILLRVVEESVLL